MARFALRTRLWTLGLLSVAVPVGAFMAFSAWQHRQTEAIAAASLTTLADAAVRMWRALPRRERDVLRGTADPRATGPKSSTYGTTIFVGQ